MPDDVGAPSARSITATLATVSLILSACGASPAPGSTTASEPAGSQASATLAPTVAATIAGTPVPTPMAQPSLAPITQAWQAGGPVGPDTTTEALAVDPLTGNLWVAVPFENRYWILTPGGTYLESWGGPGTGPGQFDLNDHAPNPDGFGAIAFAPDGSFYIGDVGNHRIQKFDAQRNFVKAWGTFGTDNGQFVQVTALATDGKRVYVGDGDRGDIQAFDTDGNWLATFGQSFGAFVCVDSRGNVYATNPSQGNPAVAKFDPSGQQLARFLFPSDIDAVGLAVDAEGNIFVGAASQELPYDSLGTYELAADGHFLRGWPIGGGEALALSPTGDAVYVSRGIQIQPSSWTYIRAYAVPSS